MSIATLISVIGVMLGVGVLVIVISVMNGFDEMWREKILSFNAHLTVSGFGVMEDPDEVLQKVESVDGIIGASPYLQSLVFIQRGERIFTPILRGVDPQRESTVSKIPEHMVFGDFDLGFESAVLGADLANQMGVRLGDTLTIYSPKHLASADELRLPHELRVTGIYQVGMYEIDLGFMITSLSTARDILGEEDGVHAIQVMTEDPFKAFHTGRSIQQSLGPVYDVQNWMQQNRQLFDALTVEKNLMFFILTFIVLVASFGIASTMLTTTYQKTSEIGLLKALGFSSWKVMLVFMWQGFIEGIIGTVLGIGFGLTCLRYRNDALDFLSSRLGVELLPKELYQLSAIPSSTSSDDLLKICISAIIICTLAGMLPALRAASLDPVRALKNE